MCVVCSCKAVSNGDRYAHTMCTYTIMRLTPTPNQIEFIPRETFLRPSIIPPPLSSLFLPHFLSLQFSFQVSFNRRFYGMYRIGIHFVFRFFYLLYECIGFLVIKYCYFASFWVWIFCTIVCFFDKFIYYMARTILVSHIFVSGLARIIMHIMLNKLNFDAHFTVLIHFYGYEYTFLEYRYTFTHNPPS